MYDRSGHYCASAETLSIHANGWGLSSHCQVRYEPQSRAKKVSVGKTCGQASEEVGPSPHGLKGGQLRTGYLY